MLKMIIYKFFVYIEHLFFFKKFENFLKKLSNDHLNDLKIEHQKAFDKLEECFNHANYKNFEPDKVFFYDLTWVSQTVKKKNNLNFNHGFLLQFYLHDYLKEFGDTLSNVTILEIGTARGYSSICMAKVLDDLKINGKIFTIDILPLEKKIFWNSPSDIEGKKTRLELLDKWKNYVSKYIIFMKGYSRIILKKIYFSRINFAFIDGSHEYEDVKNEIDFISKRQNKNDIIFFDDYNEKHFPGVVKAINEIKLNNSYQINLIDLREDRKYVIAKKT